VVKADAHGRASWLLSSNINNTGFYNSFGYITQAEIILGDDDPDWTEPPFVVTLVRFYDHLDVNTNKLILTITDGKRIAGEIRQCIEFLCRVISGLFLGSELSMSA
jgi:hypothetical protein